MSESRRRLRAADKDVASSSQIDDDENDWRGDEGEASGKRKRGGQRRRVSRSPLCQKEEAALIKTFDGDDGLRESFQETLG